MHSPHLRKRAFSSSPQEQNYLQQLFEILLHRDLSLLSHLLIYLIIIYISGLMGIYFIP